MRTVRIFFLFLFSILSLQAVAQEEASESNNGSSYSVIGVGIPQDLTSDNFRAHGVLGVSGIVLETTSLYNPALWNRSFYTQATTSLQLSNFKSSSSTSEQTNSNFSAGYLQMLFPVYPGRLGVSVSLFPVSKSNFRIVETGNFMDSAADSVSFTNDIQSAGGVNKFEAGFGLRLSKNISVGYAPSIAFLTLENSEALSFGSGAFIAQDQTTSITGTAFSQRFGIAANFPSIFSESDRIALGATLSLPYTIEAKAKRTAEKVVDGSEEKIDISSTLTNRQGDVYMPLEAAFGLGYAPSLYMNFALEGTYQKWSDFRNGTNPDEERFFSDRVKVGLGGQFHPYKRNFDNFFSRFKYSGGLSYDTGHLTIDGNDISTLWISTGLGIISKRSVSSVDISFQYGFRGTTESNLIKERIWTLGFSINLAEIMFIRPKLR